MARLPAWFLAAQALLVVADDTPRLPCGSFDLKDQSHVLRRHHQNVSMEEQIQAPCGPKCPFFSFEEAAKCRGLCLTAEQCVQKSKDHLAGSPNSTTGRCEGCRVAGCQSCQRNMSVCSECFTGLRLTKEGTCTIHGIGLFYVAGGVLFLAVAFALTYIISVSLRKAQNVAVLNTAMVARELSKLRDESEGMKRLPLTTSMVHEPHSGRGTLLYFRHMMAILVWAVFTTVSLGCLTAVYNIFQPPPRHTDAAELCFKEVVGVTTHSDHHAKSMVAGREEADKAMLWFTVVLYIVSTVGGLALALWQRLAFRAMDSGATQMQDFALIAKGFPREYDRNAKPAEKEYRAFFEGVLGRRIVGVSVCWDFHEEPSAVAKVMEDELAVLEWGDDYKDKPEGEKRPFLASVDDFLFGLGASDSDESEDEEASPYKTSRSRGTEMAARFATSGHTVVVFHRKEDLKHALDVFTGNDELSEPSSSSSEEASDEMEDTGWPPLLAVYEPWPQLSSPTWVPRGARGFSPRPPRFQYERPPMRKRTWRHSEQGTRRQHYFRQRHKITVHKLPCGPGEMCWQSYGKRWARVTRDVTVGIFCILLFMLLWGICFYGPYAYFVMFASTLAGDAIAMAGSTLGLTLGFVITLGNQLMYFAIAGVSARAGFHYSTMADNFNMSLYCVAVFINTLLDLWTTQLLSHGEKLDAQFHQAESINMRSLASVPSAQEAFAKQLWAYLFPGTIFGPFLLEPVLAWLSFKVSSWIIRSRSSVGRQKAEAILDLAKFDFTRYADNVINVMLCIIFLFFTSSVLFLSFFALVGAIFYIYLWDSYRVLRNTKEQEMDLDSTDNTAHFLNVMPCCLLATCLVYRCYKLEILGLTSDKANLVPWYMLHAAAAHGAVHTGLIFAIHRLVPNTGEEELNSDDTYKGLAQEEALNWFNANPLHCLRSKYVLGENPPCIYCVKGKEKLQKLNKACGYYFDGVALAGKINEDKVLKEADDADAVAFVNKKLHTINAEQRPSTQPSRSRSRPQKRSRPQPRSHLMKDVL